MFEDFKDSKNDENLIDILGELFDKMPKPKETASIEEQFLYHSTKFLMSVRHMLKNLTEQTIDAYKKDKLIPVMKDFVAKENEIFGE